jgi:phospholipase C
MRHSIDCLSRRKFLKLAAGAGSALSISAGTRLLHAIAPPTLPLPSLSGIGHIVVLMMENRSFDHFLGWLPNANGKQAGLTYLDSKGAPHLTHALAADATTGDFQGCSFLDPGHSFSDGRIQYNGGAANGFLLDGSDSSSTNPLQANDIFSIGYYPQAALDFLGRAAADWTVCDNYFCGIMAETYPNRFHMHAAATDRLHNSSTTSSLPTIWDRLASAGYRGRYYYSDLPFLALWGTKYLNISFPFSQFLADAAAGQLPEVSFIDPRFEDEGSGTSQDDHPHADIRAGEAFMNQIYNAVTTSPNWPSTVFIINYDEWGGFFDHLAPPVAPVPPATRAAAATEGVDPDDPLYGLLGFRTPNLIVCPWARRGYVSSEQFDHTSILKMIEWRFGLAPLTVRDQTASNIADVLDFSQTNLSFNSYSVPTVLGTPCPNQAPPTSGGEFAPLRDLARAHGFLIR